MEILHVKSKLSPLAKLKCILLQRIKILLEMILILETSQIRGLCYKPHIILLTYSYLLKTSPYCPIHLFHLWDKEICPQFVLFVLKSSCGYLYFLLPIHFKLIACPVSIKNREKFYFHLYNLKIKPQRKLLNRYWKYDKNIFHNFSMIYNYLVFYHHFQLHFFWLVCYDFSSLILFLFLPDCFQLIRLLW